MLDRLTRLDERGLFGPLLISMVLIAVAGLPLAAEYLKKYQKVGYTLQLETYVVTRPLELALGLPDSCLPPTREPVRFATELKAWECVLPPTELLAISVPAGAAYAVYMPKGLKLLAPVWEKPYWSDDALSGRWEEGGWAVIGYAVIEVEALAEEVRGPASFAYGVASLRYQLSATAEGPWPYAVKVYAYPAVDRAEISRWWRPPCEGGILLTNFVRSEVGTRCWRVEMGRRLLCFELGFEYGQLQRFAGIHSPLRDQRAGSNRLLD